MHVRVINAYNGVECRGNACLRINARARHHRARHSMTMYLRARQLRVTHVRARHDMVRQVRSRLVMMMYVRVMHAMVWNVREMHVWTEMSGQGIIWQGT
jgi:hypothetical protein